MSIEQAIADINVFCAHENSAISEFANRAVSYAGALESGQISKDEYFSLMADIDTLKTMCQTADEEYQVAKLFQAVMLVPALL